MVPVGEEWPWWLGSDLPEGHNHGNGHLSRTAIPGNSRNGKPSTCPTLIHAAHSELLMPAIKHRVISEPNFELGLGQSNIYSQKSFTSTTRASRTAGSSFYGSSYGGSYGSSQWSCAGSQRAHLTSKGNGKWWLEALEEEPGEHGEIKPAWICNFHVSEKRIYWKGLGYAKSTQGYLPHPEAERLRYASRSRPCVPDTSANNLPPLQAPMPKAKDELLDAGTYRDLTDRTATLRALTHQRGAKVKGLEKKVKRKLAQELNKRNTLLPTVDIW
eukprot:CAMPEP_0198202252 /NCGR_PEP_ID=MMETSP1445-20131203/5372_1 /TAXON_ID=36898 /ORGANISM="Pyramimonas sp., Strain CCMP2087" /LENGTH=271 /DNA_ID=CAMNT_0043873065 /DNA_START=287 /DNA_END=1099 /DNA_ORIENTATION=+